MKVLTFYVFYDDIYHMELRIYLIRWNKKQRLKRLSTEESFLVFLLELSLDAVLALAALEALKQQFPESIEVFSMHSPKFDLETNKKTIQGTLERVEVVQKTIIASKGFKVGMMTVFHW